MNRIYRKVWNKALGQLVVASELASGHAGGVTDKREKGAGSRNALAMAVLLALGMSAGHAMAQTIEIGSNANCSTPGGRSDACAVDGAAEALATDSIAIGGISKIESGAVGAVALGHNTVVQAGAVGSVALGAGSIASRANTVSVGSAGAERQITNVAAGVQSTDAVNKAQLDAVAAAAGSAAESSKYFQASGSANSDAG
ncbi:MAG: ESPR-type extended signal peptide-containing protein, partial [Stenotrophomonas sp.]